MSLKILWTTPYLPWPTVGGNRVRQFQLMRALAERGHRITLLVHTGAVLDAETEAKLKATVERVIVLHRRGSRHPLALAAMTLGRYPVIVALNGFSSLWRTTIDKLLTEETWDAVHVEHSYGLQAILPALRKHRQPFVLIEHNVESTLCVNATYHPRIPHWALRWMQRYDELRYRLWEKVAFKVPARLVAVTRPDADIMAAAAHREVDVIANGTDTSGFRNVHPNYDSRRIMFLANFGYPPNDQAVEWAVEEILPLIWQQIPNAQFVVCGNAMPPKWRERWTDPRIEWQGFVPELHTVQASCCAFLAPLRAGGGSKLKVLEAMAAGLAVVSTLEGVSGLAVTDQVDYCQGNDGGALARQLIALLKDPARMREVGANGRRYVQMNHDWRMLAEQLERIYLELPKARGS